MGEKREVKEVKVREGKGARGKGRGEKQVVVVLCHDQELALGNLGSLGWVRGWNKPE